MKISDFFVPRWQNSNPEVRKRAVVRLNDVGLLAQIAVKDADQGVCLAARSRLEDLQVKTAAD